MNFARGAARLFGGLAVTVLLAGCGGDAADANRAVPDSIAAFPGRFANPIAEAHADSAWRQKEALQASLTVRFGEEERLGAQMTVATDMSRVRYELGGDTVAVFDGSDVWVAPDSAALPRARFQLLTWPYFLAAPYKLRDPGTRLQRRGRMPIRRAPARDDAASDRTMPAARLTFEAGTGDSPDDWYMLYRDPQSNRLAAMGYIVTYGAATAAEATPHAIVYDGYQSVEGVPVSTDWTFFNWSEARGPHGQPIGRATLRNPRFSTPAAGAFTPPPGAERVSRPADP